MKNRYKVEFGLYDWHVLDLQRDIGDGDYVGMAICKTEEDAQLICDALNLKHELEQGVDYVAARSII